MDSLVVVVRLPPGECEATSGDDAVATAHVPSPQTSSADEGDTPTTSSSTKKRKPTYEARKEEITARQAEVVALREELHRLKVQQLRAREPLATQLETNATLRGLLVQQQVTIASAQALIANYGATYETPPLSTYIHLPEDPARREQILRDLKPQKIQEAVAFIVARCVFSDLTRSCRQLEDFETARGDNVLIHWEIARIPEPDASVERVYNEMLYFKDTQEMVLAEKMGLLTVRESDSCEQVADTTQLRLVATHLRGIEVEKNVVLYSQFFRSSPLLNQPHAVMVTDYIDQDDAFPYQPACRVRKDVSSATLVVACPSVAGKPPAVAVAKWTFLRIHESALATLEEREAISRDGVRGYFDLMLASVRERLAFQQQSPIIGIE